MSKLTLDELALVFRHGAGILNVHPSFDSIYRRGLAAVMGRLAEEADKGLRSTWPPYWAVWLRSIASEGQEPEPKPEPDPHPKPPCFVQNCLTCYWNLSCTKTEGIR